MKKVFLTLIIIATFCSCTEVVNIPLSTATPKLVIEASIKWELGTTGNEQTIKLTKTNDFYSSTVPVVEGATVIVRNSAGKEFNFVETPNTGLYVCPDFEPVLNEKYTLEVVVEGNIYTSFGTMTSVAPITRVEEVRNEIDQVEIKNYFEDPKDVENYYMIQSQFSNEKFARYNVSDDKFFDGNEFYSSSYSSNIKKGETITVIHYGITKEYLNYMKVLIDAAKSQGNELISKVPVAAKGNIVNEANKKQNPFGYFSLSQTSTKVYTLVEEEKIKAPAE